MTCPEQRERPLGGRSVERKPLMISGTALFYIEPDGPASAAPLVDHLTRKMTAALRRGQRFGLWGGVHECVCGAQSTSCDYVLPSDDVTNSLCVHYLAHHRAEVPSGMLARVDALACGEAEPSERELQGPEFVLNRVRAEIEERLGPELLSAWQEWGLDFPALCLCMRGGRLAGPVCLTDVRQDAEHLFQILSAVSAAALGQLRAFVQRAHGDVRTWAADALRVPGWKRELWVEPLADLMRCADDNHDGFSIGYGIYLLGPHAGAAVPTLFQLVAEASGKLQRAAAFTLGGIERFPHLLLPAAVVPDLLARAGQDPPEPQPARTDIPKRSPTLQLSAALVLARAGAGTEHAARLLVRLGLASEPDFEYVVAALCGSSEQASYAGEPGIEGWGAVAYPLLTEALQDPDWQLRARAVELLGRMGPDATPALPRLEAVGADPKFHTPVAEALLRILAPHSAETLLRELRLKKSIKARVAIPLFDPNKPYNAQYVRIVCPFCSHSDVIGLWVTSQECPVCCNYLSLLRRHEGFDCEPVHVPDEVPPPRPTRKSARKWWQFWKSK